MIRGLYLLSTPIFRYVQKRMNEEPAWQQIKVILSDSNQPGEGEHKIANYVRQMRSSQGRAHAASFFYSGMGPTFAWTPGALLLVQQEIDRHTSRLVTFSMHSATEVLHISYGQVRTAHPQGSLHASGEKFGAHSACQYVSARHLFMRGGRPPPPPPAGAGQCAHVPMRPQCMHAWCD